jgi:hypothetical protein
MGMPVDVLAALFVLCGSLGALSGVLFFWSDRND